MFNTNKQGAKYTASTLGRKKFTSLLDNNWYFKINLFLFYAYEYMPTCMYVHHTYAYCLSLKARRECWVPRN